MTGGNGKKYCEDCAHYRNKFFYSEPRCTVSSLVQRKDSVTARSERCYGGACGPAGKLFVSKLFANVHK
jgi:hypothetical protein